MTTAARPTGAVVDLHDRFVLVRSWMAALHGPGLSVRPSLTVPPPAVRSLLPTVLGWHVACALVSLSAALVVSRSGSGSAVAAAVAQAGRPGLLALAAALWLGGTALGTALWWLAVLQARA